MKQRAKSEVTPIPTIYEEELIKLRTPEWNDDSRQTIKQLSTYYSCKTALYHQRSLNIPGISTTTTDINLQDNWCLTQCIWQKTQKCGLQAYYKENNDITRFVRRAAVIPLVPHHLVADVWLNALEDIGEADNVLDTTSFTDYVIEFWFEGHRYLWKHYQTEGPRTTHHLEGWRNNIKK